MILSCPSCSAQYFADDKAIGANGRNVRCAACGHAWFAQPALSLEEKFDAAELSREKVERIRQSKTRASAPAEPHQAFRQREYAKRQSGARFAAFAAWGASFAVFAVLSMGVIVNRNAMVKLWPQASSAYAAIGLETNRFGLDFGEVEASRTLDGTTPVLTVQGSVTNTSKKIQKVPAIRVDLRDDHGNDIDSVLVALEDEFLGPEQSAHFTAHLENPPLEAFDLAMSFAELDGNHHSADDAGHDETHTEPEAHDTHGAEEAVHHEEAVADDHHAAPGHEGDHENTETHDAVSFEHGEIEHEDPHGVDHEETVAQEEGEHHQVHDPHHEPENGHG